MAGFELGEHVIEGRALGRLVLARVVLAGDPDAVGSRCTPSSTQIFPSESTM